MATSLSIGGATYDLFLTMKENLQEEHDAIQLQIGGKLEVDSVLETCGGGASNTAVALSRLGLQASFCGVVASDQWGEKLLENLRREHVDVSSVTIIEHETSSFSIVLSLRSGERTILYAAGVNEHLHDTTFDVSAIRSANAVYLNHLCETSCMIEDDIGSALAEHPDIFLAWNPGGSQIHAGMNRSDAARLLKATDLLLLNKEEALKFAEVKTTEEALQKLIKAGVTNVCITDGARGTHASDRTHIYYCPVLSGTKVIDTTGAGDAFGAAALWALLEGKSLQEAMMSGTLNAASVVSVVGAQAGLLTETQIIATLSQNVLEVKKSLPPHHVGR